MNTRHDISPAVRVSARTVLRLSAAALAVVAGVATAGAAGAQAPTRDAAPAAAQAFASPVRAAPVKAVSDRSVPRVVRAWEAAWNTGDGDRMAALFTEDGVYQDFSLDYRFTGRSEIAEFVETSVRNVSGLHVTVTDAFRTGDRVAVRFVFSGQVNGAPQPFSVPVFTVMELDRNKITYDGDYYNRLDVLRQSGLPTD